MQGDPRIIEILNEVLAGELTAVNQYFVNSKLYASWGLDRLAEKARDESIDEMRHAELLIDRILFLDGEPNMVRTGSISTTKSVADQFKGDIKIEVVAIETLGRAIALCLDTSDHGSRALFEAILTDEEAHLDWLEAQVALIERVGEAQYLAQQLRPAGAPDTAG